VEPRHDDRGSTTAVGTNVSMSSANPTISTDSVTQSLRGIRADFPILDQQIHGHQLIYFDNAASSQRPKQVIEAISNYYQHDHANVHRGIHELSNRATMAYEGARERSAAFIHARSASEIIFTRGTTESINLVAACLRDSGLEPGDRILITQMEHHSNMVPWQLIAQRTGATLDYLKVNPSDGTLDLGQLDQQLCKGVKLFSCTHISNSLGTINPVKELCARARSVGALSLIDGAQSAGHLPIDVQDMGCDFYAFSGHKICGPTGIGVLFGRQEVLEQLPPYHGGGEMIDEVDFDGATFKQAPHRFEAGTPNMAGAIGLARAMDYLDALGREQIFEHDQALANYFLQEIARFPGVRVFGPSENRGGLVSFLLDGLHVHDLVTLADQKGLALRGGHHCTQPLMKEWGITGTARASFYFYNQKEEVDRSLEILEHLLKRFGN
jgi:cysteine desulfurase/selenocysteine lyase